MTIEAELRQDQHAAMRARDSQKLNAIRSVQAEVATAKSAPGFSGDVDDELYIQTIATYVKRATKSKAEYDALGEKGVGHSSQLAYEIDYFSRFLPKVLDQAATKALIDKTIADMGADSNSPVGQVIGAVMRSGEDLDGVLVARLVQETLAG